MSGNELLSSMVIRMKQKFELYWENFNRVNILQYIAIVLDPRFKMKYVKFCLKQLYDSKKATEVSGKVESTLHNLFKYYDSCTSKEGNVAHLENLCNIDCDVNDEDKDDDDERARYLLTLKFMKELREEETHENKSELDRYLEEANEKSGEPFDILNWWNVNKSRYPVIALMAKDVLAVPVSTVASESAFSTSSRVLDNFRSTLSPSIVEALLCTQNWIKVKDTPIDLKEELDDILKYESCLASINV